MYPNLSDLAWKLYCDDIVGSRDVPGSWNELSPRIKAIYIKEAEIHIKSKTSEHLMSPRGRN